jgi:gliding motility-associated-like protein
MPTQIQNANFPLVNYSAGYNSSYPMASNPAIQIDANTGILTVTPSQIGQYVVAVCVKEYRNGQLLSINKRDFQFNVVNCTSNILAAIPGQTNYCLGRNVTFSNNSINSSFYHWDFGVLNIDYDTSNLETPNFVYSDTGTYLITLIANPGWPCADTASVLYKITDILDAAIPPQISQCLNGNNFNFTASGQFPSYSTFAWNFGPNATPQTSTQPNPTNVKFNIPDTFKVYLAIEATGCYSYDSINVITYQNPKALFNPEPKTGCTPYLVNFKDSSSFAFGLSHYWEFGDGKNSTLQNPFNVYYNPGSYDVSLRVISTIGCKDTSFFTIPNLITVLPRPNALLTADSLERSEFEPNFRFHNMSTDAIDCRLEFSSGGGSDTCDLLKTFADTGKIVVKQIVVNEQGCPDVYYLNIFVRPEYLLFIPNSFTPNSDGHNEIFKPKGIGVKQFKMEIFNRWGEEIFRSENFNEGWDGTYRGQDNTPCQSAVYAYKIYVRGVDLETRLFYGKVTLVR